MDQIEKNKKQFDEFMDSCSDPASAWDSKIARMHLRDTYYEWLSNKKDWIIFLTLTFKDEKPFDVAYALWKKLIRYLNTGLVGKNYTRIVGHSYFSYVIGIEYQSRGAIHFHVMTDKPVHFERIHTLWNKWAGFAYMNAIRSKNDVVSYVTKYALKGGLIDPYFSKRDYFPKTLPAWWKSNEEIQKELFDICPGLLSDREIGSHPGQN